MNLNLLPVFLAAAREGSVRGAATRLHCVQSNVSARLRQLEDELGAKLFLRGRAGLVLTEAGRTLLPRVEEILRLAERAWDEAFSQGEPAGPLRVGSMECTASARLPDALLAFSAQCPLVELRLTTGATRELIRKTLAGDLDAAFVAGPVETPGLVGEPVFEEELVLVASSAVPWPEPETATILVFQRGCVYRERFEAWLKEAGAAPTRVLELGSLDAILGCARAGMGLAMLPRAVVERSTFAAGLTARALPERFAQARTVFIRRADLPPSRKLELFLETTLRTAGGAALGRQAAPPVA